MRHPSLFFMALVAPPAFPPDGVCASDFDEGLAAVRQSDRKAAFQVFKAAADAGDERAYGKLGGLYLYHAGMPTDRGAAYVWFGIVIRFGDAEARRFQEAAESALSPTAYEKGARGAPCRTHNMKTPAAAGVSISGWRRHWRL